MEFGNIIVREDGSYVINNGMYHVPNEGGFKDLWEEVRAYALANPDKVSPEVEEPEPTPPELTEEEKEALALEKAKAERAKAVSEIVVEVDGMRFDGDEESQTRLSRTISAAVALGVDLDTYTQTWVLADNAIAQPTIKQLALALKLAGEEQTRLWTVPYAE